MKNILSKTVRQYLRLALLLSVLMQHQSLISKAKADLSQPEELVRKTIPGFEWESEDFEKEEFHKSKIVISLGCNCAAARHFQRHHLSEAFYPFDWCNSPFESIKSALQNDCKDFLKIDTLSIISSNEDCHQVLGGQYNIEFVHDFKNLDQNIQDEQVTIFDYTHNKTKYDRRIGRFYRALACGKEVYFFRTIATKDQALELRDLISSKFPKLNYTLVVLNDSNDFKEPWNELRIKNFFMEDVKDASESAQMQARWDPILLSLGLIKYSPAV